MFIHVLKSDIAKHEKYTFKIQEYYAHNKEVRFTASISCYLSFCYEDEILFYVMFSYCP